jgi:hypothetical protein
VGILCRVHNGVSAVATLIEDQRKCTVMTNRRPGTATDEGEHDGEKIQGSAQCDRQDNAVECLCEGPNESEWRK